MGKIEDIKKVFKELDKDYQVFLFQLYILDEITKESIKEILGDLNLEYLEIITGKGMLTKKDSNIYLINEEIYLSIEDEVKQICNSNKIKEFCEKVAKIYENKNRMQAIKIYNMTENYEKVVELLKEQIEEDLVDNENDILKKYAQNLGNRIELNCIEKKQSKLTKAELKVLYLIDEGLSNADIAEKLYITKATVKTHINHIYIKLNVKNRVQAVKKLYNKIN